MPALASKVNNTRLQAIPLMRNAHLELCVRSEPRQEPLRELFIYMLDDYHRR